MIALRGVVVDDVQDDLDSGRVQRLDHLLELDHLLAALAAAAVAVVRRQVADRVVAPVIAQAPPDQAIVVHELVHGQ